MNQLLRSCTYICILLLLPVFLQAQSVDSLIQKSDSLALQAFDPNAALEVLLEAEKLDAKNYEVLWRISRSYVDIGEHLPGETDEQEEQQRAKYDKAAEYAEKAVTVAPNKSINYLRRAIAYGRIALFEGVFDVIGTVDDVRADLEKAIALGNGGKEVQSTAHYVLGRTHAKVCEKAYLVRLPLGLGWGDIDIAFEEFEKAISMRPNFRMFHFDYAKALIEEDEYEKAREHLNKIKTLPILDEDDKKLEKEAALLLEEIKDED